LGISREILRDTFLFWGLSVFTSRTIYGRTGNGVSGGPVFNVDGEVVGLSWLMAMTGDDHVFATPVDVIREFLEEHLGKNG